jgi:hypothetical protein
MIPETVRNERIRELRKGGRSLQSIGNEYHISRERVRQLTEGIIPDKVRLVKRKLSDLSPLERLEQKTDKSGGCWNWLGGKSKEGYGRIVIMGKRLYTHRVMWESTNGSIPNDLDVLHSCDNPSCINPSHLFLGTHQDNMTDRNIKGRSSKKLSKEDVIEMRSLYKPRIVTARMLADKFHVHERTAIKVITKVTWKYV